MKPSRRLRRHLSFANVVACMALFVALGGGAYAASKVNGKDIVKHSIGANKLKNEALTSKQIKKGSLSSSVIDVSTLATVPSAQSAATANSAATAATADSAKTADTATKAASAETAARATSADSADHADSADTAAKATSADSATQADHAASAGDAETLEGRTAAQLTDVCPANTELFGGMCWDEAARSQRTWLAASRECAAEEGRLPSLSELVAYVDQGEEQAPGGHWSSDVADLSSGEEQVLVASDTGREVRAGGLFTFKYRCLFYRTNAG